MHGYVRYDFSERRWCQCREGLHALPKIMFDLFLLGGVFSYRLGHFLREGMKPSPAPGKCDQCMNMIFDFICGIRVGINPTPTMIECCNHFYNSLIDKVLHTSTVGAGFIPALPTADKIQSKYLQQHRTRIDANTPQQRGWGQTPPLQWNMVAKVV